MKMNKKIYISGAIAHCDMDERKAAFKAAEERLKTKGYNPINPFNNGLPQPGDWRQHMKVDIGLLLQCDYIYMLKDWWVSKGAKLELDVATSCGIEPVFEEDGACCDQCNTTTEQSGWQRLPRREPSGFYMKRKQTR